MTPEDLKIAWEILTSKSSSSSSGATLSGVEEDMECSWSSFPSTLRIVQEYFSQHTHSHRTVGANPSFNLLPKNGEKGEDQRLESEEAMRNHLEQLGRRLREIDDEQLPFVTSSIESESSTLREVTELYRKRLSESLTHTLKTLGWPSKKISLFHSSASSSSSSTTTTNIALQRAFVQLLILQLALPETPSSSSSPSPSSSTSSLWAFDVLLEPIDLRFRYHFEGNRRTNQLDKPEWVFSHVLDLISMHSDFLVNELSTLLDQSGISSSSTSPLQSKVRRRVEPKSEFIRGLVSMIRRRIRKDATILMNNENIPLFCHLISEVVKFDKTLMTEHKYPPPSTLTGGDIYFTGVTEELSSNEPIRDFWIYIEKQLAEEQFEVITSSENSWTEMYDEALRVANSDLPVGTVSVHQIVALMHSVQDRYQWIQNMKHRLLFAEGIHRAIANKFCREISSIHHNLLSSLKDNDQVVIYCMMLNSASYLEILLKDWDEQLFFLELQLEREKEASKNETATVQKSFFSSTISSYKTLRKEMVLKLVTLTLKNFKDSTTSYFSSKKFWEGFGVTKREEGGEREATGGLLHKFHVSEISPGICEGLALLRSRLELVQRHLTKKLLESFWRKLAIVLNEFIMEKLFEIKLSTQTSSSLGSLVSGLLSSSLSLVGTSGGGKGGGSTAGGSGGPGAVNVNRHQFHIGGAVQLREDMQCLLLIFKGLTSTPELYFREVIEACKVLTLPVSSVKLLLRNHPEASTECQDLLTKLEVHRLKWDQVISISSQRSDAFL